MRSKQLKVYGERNTGTKYLIKLIRQNFHVEVLPGVAPRYVMNVQKLLPGKELVRDVYFDLSFRTNLGWKHSLVNIERLQNSLRPTNNVSFITITKNPYAWVLSLHKRPYHQHWKEKPNFESFLQSPWKTVGRENVSRDYPNPIAVWNHKNESYMKLKQEFPTINVTYEALLSNPQKNLGIFKDCFLLDSKHEEFRNVEECTMERKKKDFPTIRITI